MWSSPSCPEPPGSQTILVCSSWRLPTVNDCKLKRSTASPLILLFGFLISRADNNVHFFVGDSQSSVLQSIASSVFSCHGFCVHP